MTLPLVIIGAGWAGLAAAARAARSGRRVVLIDEHPYVGGRARSFAEATTGEIIDNGQHLLMGCYHEVLAMLDVAGTTRLLRRQKALRVHFGDAAGNHSVLDASMLPGAAGVALGIVRLGGLSLADRLGIARLAWRIRRGAVAVAGKTCHAFLTEERQSHRAIERFWEPIVLATLNASVHEAAASLLDAVMRLAFMGNSPQDSAMLLPECGLSDLVEPLVEVVRKCGGTVLLSTSVQSFEIDNNRAVGIHLSDGTTIACDGVICAIPPYALMRLLPSTHVPAVCSAISYSPIVSVYLWYDADVVPWTFAALLGTQTQWVFNRRKIGQADDEVVRTYPGHLACTVSAAGAMATQAAADVVAQCDADLRRVLPSMQSTRLLHGIVIKERRATPCITPQIEAMRPAVARPYANVVLAGDWTGTGLPATLEGAARSGVLAYNALVGA